MKLPALIACLRGSVFAVIWVISLTPLSASDYPFGLVGDYQSCDSHRISQTFLCPGPPALLDGPLRAAVRISIKSEDADWFYISTNGAGTPVRPPGVRFIRVGFYLDQTYIGSRALPFKLIDYDSESGGAAYRMSRNRTFTQIGHAEAGYALGGLAELTATIAHDLPGCGAKFPSGLINIFGEVESVTWTSRPDTPEPPEIVTVTGRVVDAGSRLPISAAAVTIGQVTETTNEIGTFEVDVEKGGSSLPLAVVSSGYLNRNIAASLPLGSHAVDVGDILLSRDASMPVVESVDLDVNGIFLSGFDLAPRLTASVNWNGNTPGTVEFRVNGSVYATQSGAGPEYSVAIPVDTALRTSLATTGNVISVTATAQEEGKVSAPNELVMAVVPVPPGLRSVVNSNLYRLFGPDHVGFDFELTKHEQKVTLPVVGTFGFEWGANASFDYTIREGEWEAALGLGAEGKQGKRGRRPAFPGLTRNPKAKLYIGNKEINASLDLLRALPNPAQESCCKTSE